MDIFDVWEVLRVEGERLSRFSLLSLSQTLTDTGVSRGLASRRNPKRKWRFGDSTRQGRGQILIPPCLEIGTATQLGPIRTQKKFLSTILKFGYKSYEKSSKKRFAPRLEALMGRNLFFFRAGWVPPHCTNLSHFYRDA